MIQIENAKSVQVFNALNDGTGQVFQGMEIEAFVIDALGNRGHMSFKTDFIVQSPEKLAQAVISSVLSISTIPFGVSDLAFARV